ncbi:hypothetical protein MMC13_004499 [Lambiella insularis]|nr:hypothetical protein [Lambiella insularis]
MAARVSHSHNSSSASSFIDAAHAQDHFTAQFDLEHPDEAVNSYARIMREHTLRQMESAKSSASRRSTEAITTFTSLSQQSSVGSVDSRGS